MRRAGIVRGCVGIAAAVLVSGAPIASVVSDAHVDGVQAPRMRWTVQQSGVTARLRGVSAVSARVAWASGANGTILRTTDAGVTWQSRPVPDAGSLDFRDIDAVDERTAYALSIGPGDASRIFKTTDGGATWRTQYVNRDPRAFFDAMAFSTPERGTVISDAVGGAHVVLQTADGGRHWRRVPAASLPPALAGEGAFAASGTNVAANGRDRLWIATNAPGSGDSAAAASSGVSRVLRSTDGGRTWTVARAPLAAGASAGIFSIAFRDATHGVIVGGDYKKEREAIDNVAFTTDGGVTWTLVRERGLSGFRSAVAYVPRAGAGRSLGKTGAGVERPREERRHDDARSRRPAPHAPGILIAVGPSGADLSMDDGRTWRPLEADGPVAGRTFGGHAFAIAPDGACGWAVGENGSILRLDGLAARASIAPR